MLPPFIIEQIRKREREDVRPQPQLEIEMPRESPFRQKPEEVEPERGVIILELL